MTDKNEESEFHIVSGGGRSSLSGSQLDEVRRRQIEQFQNNQLFIMNYLYEKQIDDKYRVDDKELGSYLQIDPNDVWKHIRPLAEDTGVGLIRVHRFGSGRGIEIKYSLSGKGIELWARKTRENFPQILNDVRELQQQGDIEAKKLDLKILEQEISMKKWDAINKALSLPQILSKWGSKLLSGSPDEPD